MVKWQVSRKCVEFSFPLLFNFLPGSRFPVPISGELRHGRHAEPSPGLSEASAVKWSPETESGWKIREMLQTVSKAAAPPQRSSSIREVFNENRQPGCHSNNGITELLLIVTLSLTMCSNWAQLPELKDAASAAVCGWSQPQLLLNMQLIRHSCSVICWC